MNANARPIGTPSGERYIRAASKFACGETSCFARRPLTFAGEMRKIVPAITAPRQRAAVRRRRKTSSPPECGCFREGGVEWRDDRLIVWMIPGRDKAA